MVISKAYQLHTRVCFGEQVCPTAPSDTCEDRPTCSCNIDGSTDGSKDQVGLTWFDRNSDDWLRTGNESEEHELLATMVTEHHAWRLTTYYSKKGRAA